MWHLVALGEGLVIFGAWLAFATLLVTFSWLSARAKRRRNRTFW